MVHKIYYLKWIKFHLNLISQANILRFCFELNLWVLFFLQIIIIFHEQKAEKGMKSVKADCVINFSILNKCLYKLYCFSLFWEENTWKITISMLPPFYQSYLFSKFFSWFFMRIKFPEKEVLLYLVQIIYYIWWQKIKIHKICLI